MSQAINYLHFRAKVEIVDCGLSKRSSNATLRRRRITHKLGHYNTFRCHQIPAHLLKLRLIHKGKDLAFDSQIHQDFLNRSHMPLTRRLRNSRPNHYGLLANAKAFIGLALGRVSAGPGSDQGNRLEWFEKS